MHFCTAVLLLINMNLKFNQERRLLVEIRAILVPVEAGEFEVFWGFRFFLSHSNAMDNSATVPSGYKFSLHNKRDLSSIKLLVRELPNFQHKIFLDLDLAAAVNI